MHEPSAVIRHYREFYASCSREELELLAQMKRFIEYMMGDMAFREALVRNNDNLAALTDAYGLRVDAELFRPLFTKALAHHRFEQGDARWPLAQLWDRFIVHKLQHRAAVRELGDSKGFNPRFDAWRLRQIRRCSSELGAAQGDAIVHALVSYELSRGCSVGCWFCGISADRFGGAFPHTAETDRFWRGTLQSVVDRFGAAAQTGFCYWATDPCDNPDYASFLQSHYEVTGMLPQTTTAAPLKNLDLTRRVLAMTEHNPCTINRFSILTTSILHRVFAEFTASELLSVELVMQQRQALTSKSISGRVIERLEANRAKGKEEKVSLLPAEPSTIACVSGFLVNMLDRRVRLVSPTRSCKRWPDGYRVYDEATFSGVEEFAAALDRMIERHMPEDLSESDVLRFRPDLGVSCTDNGFVAETQLCRQTYSHSGFGRRLGEMIQCGNRTMNEIVRDLAADGRYLLDVHQELQGLFNRGLLDDDPVYGGINRGGTPLVAEPN